jgi:regulator of protease activity HflC (stomatin/prohibitin superfamily)
MARLRILELPQPVTEATNSKATAKRGEEAPRLAVRAEKRANKNVII